MIAWPRASRRCVARICLVLLSDVEGLYSADPNREPGARFIHEVPEITPEIEAMAGRAPVTPAGRRLRPSEQRAPVPRRRCEGASGRNVPAIHCLRAAAGVALGTNQVQSAPLRCAAGWR